ncbi:MAG: S8 family serine peptidase [Sedimentisphaerales bacterium]|nr:S8 family serine peptidase [Sedimentisphaerales bacterium]
MQRRRCTLMMTLKCGYAHTAVVRVGVHLLALHVFFTPSLADPPSAARPSLSLSPQLQGRLEQANDNEMIPVIIRLQDSLKPPRFLPEASARQRRSQLIHALRQRAKRNERPLRLFLLRQQVQPQSVASLWHINAVALRARPKTIRQMATLPIVHSMTLDDIIRQPSPVSAAPAAPVGTNLAAIGADALWTFGFQGHGIVVANMDTGVDFRHSALANWRGGDNSWFDPYGQHAQPYDHDGHGTGAMSLIAGGSVNDAPLGVAPQAAWIAVKVFNDAGEAPLSAIHRGFAWILDPDADPNTDDAPHVLNNSWAIQGTQGLCQTEFSDDIRILREAGIAVVFAAGNAGPMPSTALSPASDPSALSVGAVDDDNQIAFFSSRGPNPCNGRTFPELVAPGVNVPAADLTFGIFPDAVCPAVGTSFACAQAAGGIALLRQAFPSADLEDIEDALRITATDLGNPGADNDYGRGLINLPAAYDELRSRLPAGDLDHDNDFDCVDLALFVGEWLRSDCTAASPCRGDINHDGRVDFLDYSCFLDVEESDEDS